MTSPNFQSDKTFILRIALGYARLGWHVFPCHTPTDRGCSCGMSSCDNVGKHPRVKDWPNVATTDEATIQDWWTRWPDANIGIATGAKSGVVVLDVDPDEGGALALEDLLAEHGSLPETVESLTGGGGRHLLFQHPGVEMRNSASKLGAGLDIRGDGGYVIAPPSLHESGRRYEWEVSSHPTDVPLAPMPAWLLELVTASQRAHAASNGHDDVGGAIPEGRRNDTLASLAGSMRRRGMTEDEIYKELMGASLNLRDLEGIIAEAREALRAEGILESVSDTDEQRTDLGNARRLVARHGQNIRYCEVFKQWFIWDGRRWHKDDTGEIERLAKETLDQLLQEAIAAEDSEDNDKRLMWALKSQEHRHIKHMIDLAKTEPGVYVLPGDLDRHRHLVNLPNGTLNLHTKELYPHRREDLLTKLTRGAYSKGATHPLWDKTLALFLPNPAIRAFVQRAVGSGIEGGNAEKRLYFAYGPRDSGKTTLFVGVTEALGPDYAATTGFETFAERRDQAGALNEMARFAGKRLVYAEEISEGLALSHALVKRMTGGGKLQAKILYRDTFEFAPEFTVFLAANDYPVVSSADDPIWQRLVAIPFAHTIREDQHDPLARDTLTTDPDALTAILTWAIDGYFAYQQEGLNIPAEIQEARATYRQAMNPLGEFIDERCVVHPQAKAKPSEIFEHYKRWFSYHREGAPLTRPAFIAHLEALGFYRKKDKDWVWMGIGLKDHHANDDHGDFAWRNLEARH
jgi:putative DNA primase/helicase